ncbi:MAG: hypothetical protein ACLT98_14030 [Eggerthellaceae bacterium]
MKSDRATDAVPPVAAESACPLHGFGADLTPEKAAELFGARFHKRRGAARILREKRADRRGDLPPQRCMLAAGRIAVDDTRRYLAKRSTSCANRPPAFKRPDPVYGRAIGGEAAKLSEAESAGPCGDLLARATTTLWPCSKPTPDGPYRGAPTAGSSGVVPAMLLACQMYTAFRTNSSSTRSPTPPRSGI